MKITVKEYTEKEIEIELPCYLNYGNVAFVKIINERNCILITEDSMYKHVISNSYLSDEKYKLSTKEEFDTQFDKTMKSINELK